MRLLAVFERKYAELTGMGLLLRRPAIGDFGEWRDLRAGSAAFLTPWEPLWPQDDLTWAGYRRRLARYRRDADSGISISWFVFRQNDNVLLGGLTYSSIRYGASRSAQLGYWMGEKYAGHGYMQRAVQISLSEMFVGRDLLRVEATSVPENSRSIGLLERLGFRQEGCLREYLEINGKRRDHLLYAILQHEYEGGPDKSQPLAPDGAQAPG